MGQNHKIKPKSKIFSMKLKHKTCVSPEKGVKVNTIKEMDLTLLACEIRC